MATIYVGVDISKLTFDVAVVISDKTAHAKFSNDRNGFQDFIGWFNSKKVALEALHVCMEATGRYYKKLAKYLHALNIRVSVENPMQIHKFSGAMNSRTKTDKQDAFIIAEYCKALNPRLWAPKQPHVDALRDWITVQENRKQQLASCIALQQEMEGEHAKELMREIKGLEKKLCRTQEKIKQLIKDHDDLRSQAALLDTIPSIGVETIAVLLATIDPAQFESTNQAVAFVGLCPQIRESGTSVRGKAYMTKSGHPLIKKRLYMCSLSAIRFNHLVKASYDRLVARGKLKKVALCAAMRKLFRIAFAILKSGKPFDPNHQPQWKGSERSQAMHKQIEGIA